MKIAYVSRAYPGVVEAFYAANPGLEGERSASQLAAFQAHAFGWAGAWGPALAPLGVELQEFWLDLLPQHRAWTHERGAAEARSPGVETVLAMVREFSPDAIWLDHPDAALLARLRAACPGLRVALGWVGSALPESSLWRELDLVLSCDAASVETLKQNGAKAALLHHAFQASVLERLGGAREKFEAAFVGQFDPGAPVHAAREAVLEALLERHPVAVFSPMARRPGALEIAAKRAVWGAAAALRRAGVPAAAMRPVPGLGRAAGWPGPPRGGLPPRLAAAIRPARYGLELYGTLRDARVSLNFQGSDRKREASNMRMFEATGVGSCLLADAAPAISSLFEPVKEIVTFENAREAIERLTWLLSHERDRAAIAAASQRRCLAEHTFAHRAPRLVELLRGVMQSR